MALIFHIIAALTSLGFSTYIFFKPSQRGIASTLGLTGLTLASGTYVAAASHSHIIETCLSGLFYLGAVSVGIVVARFKLATAKKSVNRSH